MRLDGTTNCTTCFNGCPTCLTSDLSFCTSCPSGQFGASGVCTPCLSTCQTCADASTCLTCPSGSQLVNSQCYSIPSGCVSLASATTCSSCFVGYTLSTDQATCSLDTTCNATSSCLTCSNGYYLSSGQCLVCSSLPANCLTCDASVTTNCFQCSKGYYLSAGSCVQCVTGCLDCSSATFCKTAMPGYFLVPFQDQTNSGRVGTCRSPCLTCVSDKRRCTSCVPGYSLNGSHCISDSQVQVDIVFIGAGPTPVFTLSDSATTTLSNSMTEMNRIQLTICQHLPSANYGTATHELCYDYVIMHTISAGSLNLGMILSGGNFASTA